MTTPCISCKNISAFFAKFNQFTRRYFSCFHFGYPIFRERTILLPILVVFASSAMRKNRTSILRIYVNTPWLFCPIINSWLVYPRYSADCSTSVIFIKYRDCFLFKLLTIIFFSYEFPFAIFALILLFPSVFSAFPYFCFLAFRALSILFLFLCYIRFSLL